jgi:catechol 2,3-dioxygenase-like lactoylglutathione lyase family enzyme
MQNRRDVYVEEEREQPRHVTHFALRVVEAERVAEFYRSVFDLRELEKPGGDSSHYLSDGRVTLVIYPWLITDYEGSGIERPALDHVGFKVESVEAFKSDLQALVERNPEAAPRSHTRKTSERDTRMRLLERCGYGQFRLSDPDGVLIDVSER